MKKRDLELIFAAFKRAGRTAAQTALSMLAYGSTFGSIDWTYILSVSLVAAIISILTSITTGLPEATNDGQLLIDRSDDAKDVYRLALNHEFPEYANKKVLHLRIDPNSRLER